MVEIFTARAYLCRDPSYRRSRKECTMNGIYRLMMQTPFGPQRGVLAIKEQNGKVNGFLKALGDQQPVSGRVQDEKLLLQGMLKQGNTRLDYSAEGVFEGDKIRIRVKTKFGVFQLYGEKIK